MDDKQIERGRQSIGKECFVKCFEEFGNPRYKNEGHVEILMSNEGYEESGCKTRVAHSRRIIDAGRAEDALGIAIGSQRVPLQVRHKARELRSDT
jgi:hypothetical protein